MATAKETSRSTLLLRDNLGFAVVRGFLRFYAGLLTLHYLFLGSPDPFNRLYQKIFQFVLERDCVMRNRRGDLRSVPVRGQETTAIKVLILRKVKIFGEFRLRLGCFFVLMRGD